MQNKVKVEVSLQGEAVVGKQGYMKKDQKKMDLLPSILMLGERLVGLIQVVPVIAQCILGLIRNTQVFNFLKQKKI